MDFAIVVALLVLAASVTALAAVMLRTSRERAGSHRAGATNMDIAMTQSPLPIVRTGGVDGHQVFIEVDDTILATLDFEEDASSTAPPVVANEMLTAAVLEMARTTPDLLRALRVAGSRLTFSRETIQGLADGSLRMMTGDHAAAVDVATSRIVELGKVSRSSLERSAGSWPALLSGGTAIAAATLQQRQLGSALSAIDAGIDSLYQRQIDDDSGRLHAAAHLAREVTDVTRRGVIPAQLASELSVARRDIDAIYFARREQMRRFVRDIETAQNSHEARHGESEPWAKGVTKAFGDPNRFHAEALAFVRAAAVKAHLAAGTAAVIAEEGRPDHSFVLLERNEELLRTDVLDLYRRLRALAATPPEGFWTRFDGGNGVLDVVNSLVEELEERVTPLLPLDPPDTIVLALDPELVRRQLPDTSD